MRVAQKAGQAAWARSLIKVCVLEEPEKRASSGSPAPNVEADRNSFSSSPAHLSIYPCGLNLAPMKMIRIFFLPYLRSNSLRGVQIYPYPSLDI